MFFCRELANTRPTKELKAFFALAESLPTPATLALCHMYIRIVDCENGAPFGETAIYCLIMFAASASQLRIIAPLLFSPLFHLDVI